MGKLSDQTDYCAANNNVDWNLSSDLTLYLCLCQVFRKGMGNKLLNGGDKKNLAMFLLNKILARLILFKTRIVRVSVYEESRCLWVQEW